MKWLGTMKESREVKNVLKDIRKNVPTDGHCLLHTIVESTGIRMNKLKAGILIEAKSVRFKPFSTVKMNEELTSFLEFKNREVTLSILFQQWYRK